MKPSGIEWIGDIPDDWEVYRLKNEVVFVNGYAFDGSELHQDKEVPVIRIGDISSGVIDYSSTLKTNVKSGLSEYELRKNDILIAMSGATTGKTAIVKTNEKAYINQRVGIIRATKCNIFIKYLLETKGFFNYIFLVAGGSAQPNISMHNILNFQIPKIRLDTQQKIADYLDEKCGEIDATIAKQKEIIEKLKAYKQSLISETVTKGLDKSAPLKPSGIDYLGDIPNDWEIRKVKNTGKLIGGSGFPEEYQGVKDEKIPFIKVKSLAEDPISRNGKDSISESIRSKLNAEKFIKGSVVFAKVGAALLLQRFRILEFDSCIDNNMMGFIPLAIEPRFFKYVTILFDFSYFVNPGTVPSINQEQIGNIKIPFPPLKSQEKIADYLDSKCSQIDKYITEKQNIIQKLDAYKKSLIFECVTGKRLV